MGHMTDYAVILGDRADSFPALKYNLIPHYNEDDNSNDMYDAEDAGGRRAREWRKRGHEMEYCIYRRVHNNVWELADENPYA